MKIEWISVKNKPASLRSALVSIFVSFNQFVVDCLTLNFDRTAGKKEKNLWNKSWNSTKIFVSDKILQIQRSLGSEKWKSVQTRKEFCDWSEWSSLTTGIIMQFLSEKVTLRIFAFLWLLMEVVWYLITFYIVSHSVRLTVGFLWEDTTENLYCNTSI